MKHGTARDASSRTFKYDDYVLSAQLEQTANRPQDWARSPKQVIVDLGYRSVDADNRGVQIIHRGKYKLVTDEEKRQLERRQAIEPLIGHIKADPRMDRCWLQGAVGDALDALCCAADYNIRWPLRAITRLSLQRLFLRLVCGGHVCRRPVGVVAAATEGPFVVSCGKQHSQWAVVVGPCGHVGKSLQRLVHMSTGWD